MKLSDTGSDHSLNSHAATQLSRRVLPYSWEFILKYFEGITSYRASQIISHLGSLHISWRQWLLSPLWVDLLSCVWSSLLPAKDSWFFCILPCTVQLIKPDIRLFMCRVKSYNRWSWWSQYFRLTASSSSVSLVAHKGEIKYSPVVRRDTMNYGVCYLSPALVDN